MFEMLDRETVLTVLVGIVIIGGVTAISIETQMLSEEKNSFMADAEVTDALNDSDVSLNNSLGFDATTERLAFGRMPLIDHEGLSGRRFLNLNTSHSSFRQDSMRSVFSCSRMNRAGSRARSRSDSKQRNKELH